MIACRFNELTRLPLTRRRPLWCSTCGVVVPDGLEDLNAHLVAAAQRTADLRVGTIVREEVDRDEATR